MDYPLITAVVLCYNQARFVEECLEAVKQQDYSNLELIVNDDASQDGSPEVIERWLKRSGLQYRFLRNTVNQGLCRSLNNVLAQSRGKYISGIAADDVWLPGKLRHQAELMEKLPSRVGVVYSDAFQMDESGQPLPRRFIESYRSFPTMPQGHIETTLWEGNFIPALTTLIRRECHDRVGVYDESLYYEDWDIWLRIAREYEFVYSDQIAGKYRVVASSMMQTRMPRILDSACAVCLKHLRNYPMTREARRVAIDQLRGRAVMSFRYGSQRCRYNLWNAFRYKPSPQLGARLLFSLCRLGSDHYDRLRSVLRRPEPSGVVEAVKA